MEQENLDLSRLRDDAYMAGLSHSLRLELVRRWRLELQSFDVERPPLTSGKEQELSAWDLPLLGQRVLTLAESKGIDTGPAAALNALCRTGADLDLSLVHQALGIVERLEAVLLAETESPGGRDTEDDRDPKLVLDVHRKTATLDGQDYPLTERQTEFLQKLIDAGGGFVPGRKMKFGSLSDDRVDSLFKGIPENISSYIERKRGPGGGYRLSIPGQTIEG